MRVLRARYDAATTAPDNHRHWANADGLGTNAANNVEVRRILGNRCRYEVANNSYARGIVLTLANDTVGTGLQELLLEAAWANGYTDPSSPDTAPQEMDALIAKCQQDVQEPVRSIASVTAAIIVGCAARIPRSYGHSIPHHKHRESPPVLRLW